MKKVLYANLFTLALWPILLITGVVLFGGDGEIQNRGFRVATSFAAVAWLFSFFLLFFLAVIRVFKTRNNRSSIQNLLLLALALFGTILFPYVVCYIERSSSGEEL